MHWAIRQIQSCTETEMSPSPPHCRQQPEEWQQCIKKLCNQQICWPPSCLTILAANGRACWVFLSYRKNLHSAKILTPGKNSWQIDRIWLSTWQKYSQLEVKIPILITKFSTPWKYSPLWQKFLNWKKSWLKKILDLKKKYQPLWSIMARQILLNRSN